MSKLTRTLIKGATLAAMHLSQLARCSVRNWG
jgi:hypothetical protein